MDELAKTGLATPVSGPKTFILVPDTLCARALVGWLRKWHAELWRAYDIIYDCPCFTQPKRRLLGGYMVYNLLRLSTWDLLCFK